MARREDIPTYATETKVPVDKTRQEIEKELRRFKAEAFGYVVEDGRAAISFRLAGRYYRSEISTAKLTDQALRSRWRALHLYIKARLVAVHAGIVSIDEAFLADVVLPDNRRLANAVRPAIEQAYLTGEMPKMLPAPHAGGGANG